MLITALLIIVMYFISLKLTTGFHFPPNFISFLTNLNHFKITSSQFPNKSLLSFDRDIRAKLPENLAYYFQNLKGDTKC